MKPKKISVRPAHGVEGEGFVVSVYGRKVEIERQFPADFGTDAAIEECVHNWHFAMDQL